MLINDHSFMTSMPSVVKFETRFCSVCLSLKKSGLFLKSSDIDSLHLTQRLLGILFPCSNLFELSFFCFLLSS